MKDTYVTFETAVLAKKKGFNWSCSYEPFLANWNDTPSTNSYDRVSEVVKGETSDTYSYDSHS